MKDCNLMSLIMVLTFDDQQDKEKRVVKNLKLSEKVSLTDAYERTLI